MPHRLYIHITSTINSTQPVVLQLLYINNYKMILLHGYSLSMYQPVKKIVYRGKLPICLSFPVSGRERQLIAFLWLAEILLTFKLCQNPQAFISLSYLNETGYRYMVNSKIIQTWNYLMANRGNNKTLHTFQKSPPSFNSGD